MRKENTPPVPSGYQTPGNSSFLMRTLSLVSSKPLSKRDWQGRISPRTVGEKQHRRHRGEEVRSTSPPAGVQGRQCPQRRHEAGLFASSLRPQHSPAPAAGTLSHWHRQDPGVSQQRWDRPALPGKTAQRGSLPQGTKEVPPRATGAGVVIHTQARPGVHRNLPDPEE